MSTPQRYWREYGIATIANLGLVNTGYASTWFASVESTLENESETPLPEAITREQAAWIGSLIALGAVAGSLLGGPTLKYVGRKWGVLLGSVPLFLGWILIAAATHVYFIYAGRFSFGLSVGILFTTIPMYCAEIASNHIRGAVGSIMSILIVTGSLLGYAVCPYLTYGGSAYFGVSLTSIFAILIYLMPESPFFYLSKGDRESAHESLSIIRGKSCKEVEDELYTIAKEVEVATKEKGKISDLWANKGNIKALYICCGLLVIQPFTGMSSVQTYVTNIFQNAGMNIDPFIASIIFGVIQVFAGFLALLVIDRWGRRFLLMLSALGMVVTLGLFGVYSLFEQRGSPVIATLSFAPLVLVGLNVIIYSIGFGPACWALVGELFAINIRPMASQIVCTLHWTTNFLLFRYFYSVVDSFGLHIAFWIFSGASFIGFLFTFFLVPETKGRSFQEIQDILNDRKLTSSEELTKTEAKLP